MDLIGAMTMVASWLTDLVPCRKQFSARFQQTHITNNETTFVTWFKTLFKQLEYFEAKRY